MSESTCATSMITKLLREQFQNPLINFLAIETNFFIPASTLPNNFFYSRIRVHLVVDDDDALNNEIFSLVILMENPSYKVERYKSQANKVIKSTSQLDSFVDSVKILDEN